MHQLLSSSLIYFSLSHLDVLIVNIWNVLCIEHEVENDLFACQRWAAIQQLDRWIYSCLPCMFAFTFKTSPNDFKELISNLLIYEVQYWFLLRQYD